jgi:amidase
MTDPLWAWTATRLARAIAHKEISSVDVTKSVLARIEALNPQINALTEILSAEALSAAQAADEAVANSAPLGSLHGIPITTKINADQAGRATTNGAVGLKNLIAAEDSPQIANLRKAGAIIVGRNNAPVFSFRWFTDNDLHGRTLNPWNASITPGGSSGGAAAAVATGMGAIAHGNDYGGSVRYPAWACGVVGLRPTTGRVPAFNSTAKEERPITSQMMSVQGPLTRSVNDARIALRAMAQPDARDPVYVQAPLEYPPLNRALRVALFSQYSQCKTASPVSDALAFAAKALAASGAEITEAAPPHFEEANAIWSQIVFNDSRRLRPMIEAFGDAALKRCFDLYLGTTPELDRDAFNIVIARRLAVARAWSLFFTQFDVVLMPVSWELPFPVDEDLVSVERMRVMLQAQSPMLAPACLGLPGLSVPTGIADGLPTGVQLVSARFREDLCLAAGEIIESAAGFSAVDHLFR